MRFFLAAVLSFLFTLACSLAFLQVTAPAPPEAPRPVYTVDALRPQRAAAHHIVLNTPFDGGLCSAVAVAPNTLLTAAHCAMGTGKVQVDGKSYNIVTTLFDERDHMLMILDHANFRQYAAIRERRPFANEHVRIWGWPGKSQVAVYREGSLDAVQGAMYVFTMPVFNGDSGSGLFADDGTVISVVSVGDRSAHTGVFAMRFTPGQLKQIR